MNNVELVQQGYQHFSEGNIEAVLDLFHPDIVWDECQGFPFIEGDGIFKGQEAVVQGVFSQLPTHYDDFSIDVQELFGCGEKVVMVGHYRGTYKATGKQFEANATHVWTVKGFVNVNLVIITLMYTNATKYALDRYKSFDIFE